MTQALYGKSASVATAFTPPTAAKISDETGHLTPAWQAWFASLASYTVGGIDAGALPGGFSGFNAPTAKVGLSPVVGTATTAQRSDSAPQLDVGIAPTWTGAHIFSASLTVNGALTANGIVSASATPLTANTTRVETGVANRKTNTTTANTSALAADSALLVTLNETGTYAIEAFFAVYEATSGVGGFQFDFGNGTATLSGILFSFNGYSTTSEANAASTSAGSAQAFASAISTNSAAPSWMRVSGVVTVSAAGTLGVRWAQSSTNANSTSLLAGSYVKFTKIG